MEEVREGLYRHFKGKLYYVIGTARNSEHLSEELVVYKALYEDPVFGNHAMWVRPKSMFLENVKVGGKEVPRFEYIG